MNQTGIYEQLITQLVEQNLDRESFHVGERALETAEAATWLSRFLTRIIEIAMDSVPSGDNRISEQINLANTIVQWLSKHIRDEELISENLLDSQGKILTALLIQRIWEDRDYDFDFAITEFRDHRGLIQTCGRVLRHRHVNDIVQRSIGCDNANILMLDRSLRYYDTRDPCILYSKPGFQDTFNVSKDEDGRGTLVEPLTSEESEKSALELSEFNDGDAVNASVMMQCHANARAKELELRSIELVCNHPSMSLENLFSPANFVSTRFSEQFPFRRNSMDKLTTFAVFDGQEIKQVAFHGSDKKMSPVTKMSQDYDIQTTVFVNQQLLLTQRSLIAIMRDYKLDDGRLQTLDVSNHSYRSDIHKIPVFDTILGFI